MSLDEQTDPTRTLFELPQGQLRIAPLGEIRAYQITEEELDRLEQGSPASLWLNFGLALASVFLSFLTSLLTTATSDRTFTVFVVVCVASGLASAILLTAWWQSHKRQAKLVDQIRSRMPPRPGGADAGFVVEQSTGSGG